MIEAFNLDLLDDLRHRRPIIGRPGTPPSGSRTIRLRAGRALIALGRRLDPEPTTAQPPRRRAADCA